ncbi:MAG TPA: hypothetical protein PK514_09630 [Spirochaetota bacterium]|nr:hypothetical protein [Spirochaetota bacterium]
MTAIAQTIHKYYAASPLLQDLTFWIVLLIFLLLYRLLRKNRWRRILGASLDYHRYHLGLLTGSRETNEKCRSLYQAMLWAVNKQLPDDLKRAGGKGGMVLFMSFAGDKTCINTCGTVFYETARNYSFIDRSVVRLNDTLISTFYRILLLESLLAPFTLIYMDIRLLASFITRADSGIGRLYREMLAEIKKNRRKE